MKEGDVINNFIKSAHTVNPSFGGNYEKPQACPHCGFGNDAIPEDTNYFYLDSDQIIFRHLWRCTSCNKKYFSLSKYKNGSTDSDNPAPIIFVYPSTEANYKSDIIEKFSPRFIEMYNQSLSAELRNDLDLASMGFRAALEILVKDYAINELHADEDVVCKNSLYDAIGEYLKTPDLVASADVVRILGNDYVHYKRKYPEHDFVLLKSYMDIFINQVENLYRIAHPPVSRNSN